MKDDKFEKLLGAIHRVDKRLAVVESKVSDIPDIKKSLEGLKIRVAGISASTALIVTFVVVIISKVLS